MSPHVALPADALNHLLCMIGLGGGWIEVRMHHAGRSGVSDWIDLGERGARDRVARLVEQQDMRNSADIALSLPRRERGWGTVDQAYVMWCRIEGGEQTRRAKQFRPLPTLILREGSSSRRLLLWALDRPLSWEWSKKANRRIAYNLGAKQNVSDGDTLMITPPGTCLRVGRKRPSPVVVARLTDDIYAPAQVVGSDRPAWPRPLKDPPEVKFWDLPKKGTG